MDFSKPKYETELRIVLNSEHLTADELVSEIKTFMLAIGYHAESVANAFDNEAESVRDALNGAV